MIGYDDAIEWCPHRSSSLNTCAHMLQGIKTISGLGVPTIMAWLQASGISGSDLIVSIQAYDNLNDDINSPDTKSYFACPGAGLPYPALLGTVCH